MYLINYGKSETLPNIIMKNGSKDENLMKAFSVEEQIVDCFKSKLDLIRFHFTAHVFIRTYTLTQIQIHTRKHTNK